MQKNFLCAFFEYQIVLLLPNNSVRCTACIAEKSWQELKQHCKQNRSEHKTEI